MRDTFDEQRFYRGRPPVYQRPRRRGRGLLYLFFFILGALTTIALSLVVSPALMQGFLKLFIEMVFEMLVWLSMHPLAMICVFFSMILIIIALLRDRRGR